MHRSSESVAALASALAKAQAELVNPEKSLTAIIRTGRMGEGERSFRYAPLSSGLDIVRKALGQHEIATVQTTAIDQASGIVSLKTMLAHASGEWIASDWPVCSVAEIANPQRMGAALTYARRYTLFTLVGIAGEDDLDAPDLCNGAPSPTAASDETSPKPRSGEFEGPLRTPRNGKRRRIKLGEWPSTLEPDQSAALRQNLLRELGKITSTDGAAVWAHEALPGWLSDTLCQLMSGGAFSTRRLFTDQDEVLFSTARPVILNGIEDMITRPDLADRAILLMLPPIPERRRRSEIALWQEFNLARPQILGALLDAAAHGLKMLPRVRLKHLPRMADFALWAAACEGNFRAAGTLERAYLNNRSSAIENIVDTDPVAARVRELMADRVQWMGSASDLLQAGTNGSADTVARPGWPKSPRALAGQLRRAQTFLRGLGIEIVFGREGRLGTRTISVTNRKFNHSQNIVSTVSGVGEMNNPEFTTSFSVRSGTGPLATDPADGADAK